MGWAIPPFIILAAKTYLSSQYQGTNIPKYQVISVSKNGQTINKLSIKWLKHFNKHIKSCIVSAHQLLVINGYKSHKSLDFQAIYKESKIITLYMPVYTLYLLQPLDIGCFLPLKRTYRTEINGFIRNYINYINKLPFLIAFRTAFNRAFIKANIYASL